MKTSLKHYLHLHFIVFIWGFTAVLGKLISIDALPLAWYRMGIASLLILVFIFILASFCTAYAFIGGVHVMKYISPYSVVLTINLEPVYGIILAFIIFGDSEQMNPMFYVGAFIILVTVIANGILKNEDKLKKQASGRV